MSRLPVRLLRPATAALAAAGLVLSAGLIVLGTPPAPSSASPSPTSCVRTINGVEWTLDPCIAEGEPLPPDFQDAIDDLAACPPDSPSPTTATIAARPQQRTDVTPIPTAPASTTPASPTSQPTTPPTATATTVPTQTGSPQPSPSGDDPQCPPFHDPIPWPDYPPPGSTPTPTPPDPTTSPDPLPATCPADTPSASPLGGGNSTEADPKDESADLIECRKPGDIPDPKKAITLVAAGNSLVSAHHQTGFGIGTCDHTQADGRGMPGNHAMFSFVGRYYKANPQILDYYNFARTGFGTVEIMEAKAATTDGCNNPWNRTDTPIKLSDKVVRAAKAAGRSAYFIADGGVNNTNWVKMLAQLAQCAGADFTVNNLLAGLKNFGVKVEFHYIVPKVAATDPPNGLKKNIIDKGGECYSAIKVFGKTWAYRIAVPAYDGPGSPAPSPRSARIKKDVGDAVQAMLNAGADKIVWMLYYDINLAQVDLSNLGYAAARSYLPNWISQWLPGSVAAYHVPIVEADFAGQVRKMTTDLDNEIKAGLPANAKVKAMTPPANFGAADIQDTAIGGCPHPNDSGHKKLADLLKTTYDNM